MERKLIQDIYMRTCRDSGFTMSHTDVAIFVGQLLKLAPFEVYLTFGSMDTMTRISKGSHPVCKING